MFAIARDHQGDYWFGTDRGLSRYDGSTWQTIDKAAGMPDERVYALAVTPSGEVWAGTRGSVIRIGR